MFTSESNNKNTFTHPCANSTINTQNKDQPKELLPDNHKKIKQISNFYMQN